MSNQDFIKRFLTIVVIILFIASIWYLHSIWTWAFLSLIVSVTISIPIHWLQQRGWKQGAALAASILGAGTIIILLILWIVPTLLNETSTLFNKVPDSIKTFTTVYRDFRSARPLIGNILPPLERLSSANHVNQLSNFLNSESLLPLFKGISSTFSTLINIGVMLMIAVFFLLDPESYVRGGLKLLPRHLHKRALEVLQELYHTLTSYVSSLSVSISITVFLVWFILGVLLKVPNAAVIAAFSGLATFIPNIGAIIPIIPITVFTLADNPSKTIIALVAYLLIQFAESSIFTPAIVKAELNLPSGLLLLFQLTATLLFGTLGLLIAVPLLAVIITLVRELYSYDVLKLQDYDVPPINIQ